MLLLLILLCLKFYNSKGAPTSEILAGYAEFAIFIHILCHAKSATHSRIAYKNYTKLSRILTTIKINIYWKYCI